MVSAYDEAGNLTLRTDEAGVAVQSSYDVVNRLTLQYQAGGASGLKARFIPAWGNAPGNGTTNHRRAESPIHFRRALLLGLVVSSMNVA